MLKNISPLISPSLLKILCEMGHGDEIVLADANFPAESIARNSIIVRADGIGVPELLEAILSLFPLDQYDSENFLVMQTVADDPTPVIWKEFDSILKKYEPECKMSFVERFDYYDRAKNAYAVVATGEKAQYSNVILKKGVIA